MFPSSPSLPPAPSPSSTSGNLALTPDAYAATNPGGIAPRSVDPSGSVHLTGIPSFADVSRRLENLDNIVDERMGPGVPANGFPGVGSKDDWMRSMKIYNRANLLRHRKQYQEAVELYNQAISIYSFDADCYHNLALCYKQMKDYTNSEKMYREALRLRPESWDTWFNYGNLLIEQSRIEDAKKALAQALRYNPPTSFQQNIQNCIATLNRNSNSNF